PLDDRQDRTDRGRQRDGKPLGHRRGRLRDEDRQGGALSALRRLADQRGLSNHPRAAVELVTEGELGRPESRRILLGMGILIFLLFGLVVGLIARALMPGPDPMGWGMTMLLGIAGSFLGWVVGRIFGLYHSFEVIKPAGFVMSLLGAL